MNIGLITIGSELLNGTRTDTNATWIGNAVISSGGKVVWHITTNDNKNDIIYSLKNMPKDINTIICTGGLGPTHDDITAESISKVFNLEYGFHKEAFAILEKYYEPGEFNEGRQKMAKLPVAAKLILKDLNISQEMSKKINFNTILGKKALELYKIFCNQDKKNLDYAAIIKLLDR